MTISRVGLRGWALATALVWCSPHPTSAEPLLRAEAEGVLEASPERVRAVLLDLEGFGRWFPTLVDWRLLTRADAAARVYGRQAFPWPVNDRDYVARYRWWSEGEVFVLEAVGERGDPPPPEGVTRLERFRSEWRIEPLGSGRTRARYVAEAPVEGRLSRWIANIAWRSQTRRVIDSLAREVERRGPPRAD